MLIKKKNDFPFLLTTAACSYRPVFAAPRVSGPSVGLSRENQIPRVRGSDREPIVESRNSNSKTFDKIYIYIRRGIVTEESRTILHRETARIRRVIRVDGTIVDETICVSKIVEGAAPKIGKTNRHRVESPRSEMEKRLSRACPTIACETGRNLIDLGWRSIDLK